VPLALRRGDVVLEGYIDLVIDSPDGLEIVDWKTDAVAPGAIAERLRSYELQAGLYVAGLETATGREVTRVTYVFVSANEERSPGEPAALRDAALARLAMA
jgi:ATP-dependent helicase/nuclease subunit A